MLKSLIKARIRRFGRHYDYDTGYLEATADAGAGAVLRLMMTRGLSKRPADFPPAPYYAAMLRAAAWEDCGPCTQLMAGFAVEDGVDAATIRAVLARDYAALPRETALAARFADAALGRTPDAAGLREDVRGLWGDAGVVALSLVLCGARIYPAFKNALGYGEACSTVTVGSLPPVAVQGFAR